MGVTIVCAIVSFLGSCDLQPFIVCKLLDGSSDFLVSFFCTFTSVLTPSFLTWEGTMVGFTGEVFGTGIGLSGLIPRHFLISSVIAFLYQKSLTQKLTSISAIFCSVRLGFESIFNCCVCFMSFYLMKEYTRDPPLVTKM